MLLFGFILTLPTTIYYISLIISSIVVYKDAKARNEDSTLWVILTLFVNFIAIILYIIFICRKKNIKNNPEVIDMRSNDNNDVPPKRKTPVFLFFHLAYSVIFYLFHIYLLIMYTYSFDTFVDTSRSYTNPRNIVSIEETDYEEYINSSVIAVDNVFEISKKNIDTGNIKTIKFNNTKENSILLIDLDTEDFIRESNSLKMDIFQENGSDDFKVTTATLDLENLSYDLDGFKGTFYVNIYTESFINDLELELELA